MHNPYRLATTNHVVSVSCSIHLDKITEEEINDVLRGTNSLVAEAITTMDASNKLVAGT